MPRCFEVDLIDVILGTILGRLILGAIDGLWTGFRERHSDGSMPGGGDTVFGVPSRHGRENFPPASGTDTPLVASGEPNESDSSEKRHIDGQTDG